MAFKETKFYHPPKGWPLTMQDILMERVQIEDKIMHRNDPAPVIPEYKPMPSGKWQPAAKYGFASQIIRFAHSVMP